MNKLTEFVIGVVLGVVIVTGAVALLPKPAMVPTEQVAGGAYNVNGYNAQYFVNGLYVSGGTTGGKFDKMYNSSTTPTTTLSTLAVAGHLTLGTGQTSESASTTAITSSSDRVIVQLEQTTPIVGVTCNTTLNASSSESTSVVASSTNNTLNGFIINVSSAPVTNPFCYSYSISHGY